MDSHLLSEGVGVSILSVEILTADADGDQPRGAVLLESGQKRRLLSAVMGIVLGPDTSQDLHAGVESRGNGLRQGVAVAGGVDSDGIKAVVAWEALDHVHVLLPISLDFARAIGSLSTNVEALVES